MVFLEYIKASDIIPTSREKGGYSIYDQVTCDFV